MLTPLVSIITLTYKNFAFIYETIESVLSQNYSNIEYIISDDGSKNFPENDIETFIENHVKDNIVNYKLIRNAVNLGTVKNANNAYRQANGEIIMPLSGDDVFCSDDIVSQIVKRFEKTECGAILTAREAIDDKRNTLGIIPNERQRKYLDRLDTSRKQYMALVTNRFFYSFSGSALYMKKDFFDQMGGFDEKYQLLEDGPFFAKTMWENKYELAFDIVSIKYSTNGVSGAVKNPILMEDAKLFNKTDKQYHLNELSFIDRQNILYSCERGDSKTSLNRWKARVKYPLGFLTNLIYEFNGL